MFASDGVIKLPEPATRGKPLQHAIGSPAVFRSPGQIQTLV